MAKVWANKLSYQKEIDMIPYSLFGFGVPNPDESGCSTVFECDKGSQARVKFLQDRNFRAWQW